MKKKILKLLSFIIILTTVSCREELENDLVSSPEKTQLAAKVTSGLYESPMPYNINVVYFIPSDGVARPEYDRRVSEFMIAAQEYYRQNMYNWGYGNRSFGLLVNPATNRIKINIINGALPTSSYPYAGGGNKIQSEVNNWFSTHPADKTSDHTIIFTSVPTPETEIPYYGLGKTCFVGDNEAWDYQYFNQNTSQGAKAKWYMGGFLHELGHALNLPHTALAKSQANTPGYGTSLMGTGNSTYGYSSTILTKSSCAILNNCQVFSTTAKPTGYFYASGKSFEITSITSSYSNGRINISGTYTANAPLNSIISYFVPGSAYYAPSGLASYTANTFSTYIDVEDLYFTDRDYTFALQATFLDGSLKDAQYFNFTFVNGVPDVHFQVDRTSWTVSSSSQYSAYPATYAIDGNINTYWHSNYDDDSVQTDPIPGQPQDFPYYFDINMNSIKGIGGLSFIQHQGLVRTGKNIRVWTRPTTADGWKLQGSYVLENIKDRQYITFPQEENCRFVRITFDSSYDGQPYVAIPEIGAFE